jgi:hypothetical protein
MDILVQTGLAERAVFQAVRDDASLQPHYERQFADCFESPAGALRDEAFARLHERWFHELGLYGLIAQRVNEFPRLRERINRLVVTHVPTQGAQSAELFGAPGRYTAVIAVAAVTLLDAPAFTYWARREFQHLDDMLNPDFGYDAKRRPGGATAAARNLALDRYTVLWAACVDARLVGRRLAPDDVRIKRQQELIRVFSLTHSEETSDVLAQFWRQAERRPPTHGELLDWARQGLPGFRVPGRTSAHAPACAAGSPCPLCGFSTFDWIREPVSLKALQEVLRADFPDWMPDQPICGRCAEVYRAGMSAPSTRPGEPCWQGPDPGKQVGA